MEGGRGCIMKEVKRNKCCDFDVFVWDEELRMLIFGFGLDLDSSLISFQLHSGFVFVCDFSF